VNLEGSVALVTGASRGIGRATARALHQRGAAVGLLARSEAELTALAAELGGRTAVAVADVADAAAVDAAVASLVGALGPVDVLVNNAGVGAYASVLEEDPTTHERLMRVNYLGTVHPTLAVLPAMAARRRGHIVNVASIAGRVGAPFEAAYSASKFAVVGWSEALAAEMAPLGVRVSLVNPGPVATSFTDARGVPFQRSVPRPIAAEQVAAAIVHAVEHDRFEQTLPRWLRIAPIVRAVAPNLYRRSIVQSTRKESAALARRFGSSAGD
jgi:3-oxoacyl-[acyl-carrier protein] reductase